MCIRDSHVAYPEYDWKEFGNKFVAGKLGLEREEYTTQISNYDNLGAIFDAMKLRSWEFVDRKLTSCQQTPNFL